MNKDKTILTLLLTLIIIFKFPANIIYAQNANTPKEEVVYANLSPNGIVDDINVVNIFDSSNNNLIIDYGSYQNIRNMTGTEKIQSTQDTITINNVKEERLFYEGHLENKIIPWDIKISYYLNGVETTAQEMAGKSGFVEIHLEITQNKNCSGNFYDKYALQANIILNSEKFKNIITDGATIANVGKNKQFTYTILPGKGINTIIKANVTDFELEAININGIPLNLDIDVDTSELTNKVNELNEALDQLDNGSHDLTRGISTLETKINQDLLSGTRTLHKGSSNLQNGVSQVSTGVNTLNSGSSQLEIGANSLASGTTDLKGGIDQIQAGLEALNSQSTTLTNGSSEFKNALKQLQDALNGISISADSLTQLSEASVQINEGIIQLKQGITVLKATLDSNQFKETMNDNGLNIDELQTQNDETIKNLTEEITELNKQIEELKDQGVDTSSIEAQIEQLKGIIQLLTADNAAISGSLTYIDTIGQQATPLVEGANSLEENYQTFNNSIQGLVSELSNLVSEMTKLTEGVNTLVKEYDKLDEGIINYTLGVNQILEGYSKVSDGASSLVNGSRSLKEGLNSLHTGSESLVTGVNELYNGSGTLNNGISTLENGVVSLDSGVNTLLNGSKQLSDGTLELKTNTSGIDKEITDKINDTISSISGDNIPVKSFVSDKNTNIKSVQFVLKTEPIKVNTQESTPAEPKKNDLNFWQKLLKLFGLYKEN